jgi:hypothetical protein
MKSGNKSGASAIWDGPLSEAGRPKGQGSSSGIKGMKISQAPVAYSAGPITGKAQK